MATLIIGGGGFLGQRLIERMCQMGEQVISFSTSRPQNPIKGCTYIQGDITEYGTINMILQRNKIDRMIHNAAVSHPKLYADNPYKICRINVTGTLTTLEAARNFGVERFIYMSSGAVYGNAPLAVVDEQTPLRAESMYAASKIASEELVRNYGLDSTSLRIGFIYGPGRQQECPVHQLLSDCIQKPEVRWEHGRDQVLDYIYIDDCVEGCIAASFASHLPHAEYNIGGGSRILFSDIVEQMQKFYPEKVIEVGAGDLGYSQLGAFSIQRAQDDFEWSPVVCMHEGVRRYHEWISQLNFSSKSPNVLG